MTRCSILETAAGTDPLLADSDADGVNDNLDALPLDATETIDTDLDGIGNNADPDDDGDGVLDANDAFDTISLDGRTDTDGDGFPDVCDQACQGTGMIADSMMITMASSILR